MGKARAELVTPAPDRLIAHDHAAFEEQLLDVTKAELKPEILAHGATDDDCRKAMAVIDAMGGLRK
jgi:hypothetical protein